MRANLVGRKFGRLTIVRQIPLVPHTRRYYCEVECECGAKKVCQLAHVTSGHTRSCGCFHASNAKLVCAKVITQHGHTRAGMKTPEYISWDNAKARCLNRNNPRYSRYGGRGITFCKKWQGKGGFARFFADMGKRPLNHSLDRKNNDGNYTPRNCKWSTAIEQANNTRHTERKAA